MTDGAGGAEESTRDATVDPDDPRRVADCERCPALVESRSRIVNGVGAPEADLLFVGEGPGAEEDARGEPFVGRSGDVLDEALAAAGLAREDVRITNCVRCRPPDNRDPRVGELANCASHLEREVAAVEPALVVGLGKVPCEHLLDRDVAVTAEAGAVETASLGGAPRDVMVCVHPAATLYDPSQREPLADAVAAAAERAGGPGQASLGEF
ncbi:MAG: uracil-DNA glycosylase family protein [Halobacteriaceae archaeon]